MNLLERGFDRALRDLVVGLVNADQLWHIAYEQGYSHSQRGFDQTRKRARPRVGTILQNNDSASETGDFCAFGRAQELAGQHRNKNTESDRPCPSRQNLVERSSPKR